MQVLLTEFIDTLDASLKAMQAEAGARAGLARLTLNQFRYLDAIHALGKPTVSQLADRLNIAKPSVTTGLNKLAALGYVVKTQSDDDKRVWRVALTPACAPLFRAKQRALEEYEAFIRSALSECEVRQLEKFLVKLVRLFKASSGK